MALKNRQQLSPRDKLIMDYKSARTMILAVVILTVVSLLTTMFSEDGTYYLFSAAIPRYLVLLGVFFYPEFFSVFTVVAVILTAFYLVCWFLTAKGNKLGFIIGIVLFAIDTVAMVFLFEIASIILDLVIHVVVLISMISGIVVINKLKSMPVEEPVQTITEENQDQENVQ